MNEEKKYFVTRPHLPPLNEFIPFLEKIWSSGQLTNGGPYHQELEEALCIYLNVEHISLFSNATIALITAMQALKLKGEIITTPYSFVATANSILWNHVTPVFVDIESESLNIDPDKISAAVNENTSGILPVHCYGNPCNVSEISNIAGKFNLKVIYDAAHAFGVKSGGRSLLSEGDLSILSFHATKVFHTFEGGAIISKDVAMKRRIDQLKNFGFINETTVNESGINGKMSELNAAFGLLEMRYVSSLIKDRQNQDGQYRKLLVDVEGIRCLHKPNGWTTNGAYFPILVNKKYPLSRDQLYEKLKQRGIFARRYFYPLISNMPMYSHLPSSRRENLPIANEIANQIICLPIYPGLEPKVQNLIVEVIKGG